LIEEATAAALFGIGLEVCCVYYPLATKEARLILIYFHKLGQVPILPRYSSAGMRACHFFKSVVQINAHKGDPPK